MYIHIARLIKSGNWIGVYDRGFYSLYPFTMIVFQKIFQDWEIAGRMASAFFGSLAVFPLFFMIRKMLNTKIAVITCIFFIVSPRIAEYSSDVLREPLFWLLALTALWAGWKGFSDRNWVFIVFSSLFTGLACFTRMEGVGLILILCSWSVWLLAYRRRDIKRCLVLLIVFFMSFPLIFVGPLYFLKAKTGRWEMGHAVSKIPMLIKQDSKAMDSEGVKQSTEEKKKKNYLFFIWEAFYKYFRSFHPVLLFLFLFGIVRRKAIPYSRDEIPVLAWASIYFIISLLYAFKVSYVSTRHGLLVGIPSLVWVSAGFLELSAVVEKYVQKTRLKQSIARHAMVYLLIIVCVSVLPKTLLSSDRDKMEMKKAGVYLKSLGYSREKFAVESRINRLTFYCESQFVDIPSPADYAALNKFLKTEGVSYLVVDERTIGESITGFKENISSMNLEKINIPEFAEYKEYSFVLYRIKR